MEAYDYQADFRRTRLYQTTCQVREIYSTYGTQVQKGKCYSELGTLASNNSVLKVILAP